jgi:hypothetical protein
VRGFFIKLVPDCILPVERRRTRFHEDDAESDAGSVRRYRLALPEEKDGVETSVRKCVESGSSTKGPGNGSAGLFRRWAAGLGFGRRSSARSDSIH